MPLIPRSMLLTGEWGWRGSGRPQFTRWWSLQRTVSDWASPRIFSLSPPGAQVRLLKGNQVFLKIIYYHYLDPVQQPMVITNSAQGKIEFNKIVFLINLAWFIFFWMQSECSWPQNSLLNVFVIFSTFIKINIFDLYIIDIIQQQHASNKMCNSYWMNINDGTEY